MYNCTQDSYLELSAEYVVSDNFKIRLGYHKLLGDDDTFYGMHDQDESISLKLRLSF